MPVERINGRELHVQVLGKQGPWVVMLHGMMLGTLATWYLTTAPALARRRRVLMFDLPGHGLSPRTPDGYGVRRLAEDVGALVDHHAPGETVSLVGHSYGAVVMLRYALDHPAWVDRLVIIEAPLPVATRAWLDAQGKALRQGVRRMLGPWRWLAFRLGLALRNRGALLKLADPRSRDRALGLLPEFQRRAMERGGRRAHRLLAQMEALATRTSAMEDMLADPDIADGELAAYPGPVLLLYGTRTLPEFAKAGRRLAQVLPQARIEWLDGGHMLTMDAPTATSSAIGTFLDG